MGPAYGLTARRPHGGITLPLALRDRLRPSTRTSTVGAIQIVTVLVVKGSRRRGAIGQPSHVEVTIAGRKFKRGVRLWPVATGMLKSELYRWLKLHPPADASEPHPPGYCHFPQVEEEYFRQLTAEALVERKVRGYKKLEWTKTRDRNEALDTRIYARAAAAQFGIDRFSERRWLQLRQAIDLSVEAQERERTRIVAQSPHEPSGERKPYRPRPIVTDDPWA